MTWSALLYPTSMCQVYGYKLTGAQLTAHDTGHPIYKPALHRTGSLRQTTAA